MMPLGGWVIPPLASHDAKRQNRSTMKTLILLFSLISLSSLQAQTAPSQAPTSPTTPQQEETQDGLWQGTLAGGRYVVRANAIIALSKHEYISDGVARVVEVNLTLNSAQVVRFYFLEPVKPETNSTAIATGTQALEKAKGLFEQAAGRVSPTLTQPRVVKNYPTSTHAHTVEFVLKEEARLDSLLQSLERSLRTGRGRTWKE
jgi:hypothetical protein